MRGLGQNFIDELVPAQSSIFSSLLEYIHGDTTLDVELRNNSLFIYYRGGKLLEVRLVYQMIPKYTPNKKYLNPTTTATSGEIENCFQDPYKPDWKFFFPGAKQAIDIHLSGKKTEEREYQQLVVRENNYSSISNGTDYFIIDTEYSYTRNARFDLVAMEWLSEGSTRKLPKSYRPKLAIIEMKYSERALGNTSGLLNHYNDINGFLQNKTTVNTFRAEMLEVFNQKRKLGLIPCLQKNKNWTKDINDLEDDIDIIYLLANHDPASDILDTELKKLSGAGVKLVTSNFMGYGLYRENVFNINDFTKRFAIHI